ncbi:MFS transporter (plasmid) [Leuconostoc mesenteroides]|uniref:oligosaccharide MFS transporter n=1 Tax=Leuconostoc mesenteroides TaxID=1245 RepID=UPI0009C15DC2|nr:MFS transporter [Leuconostoc mesenteroides]QAT28651.1 MFS transporter [Leuconostoc mesenteroides]QAT28659.1 MFS transporter [Leuconostoc mesenteroides]QEA37600.1 MFS transporter [Leuconostoc citreum]
MRKLCNRTINAVFGLFSQPIFGYISDKFGNRKNLLYFFAISLTLTAPFFIFVYEPLLRSNFIFGAIIGAIILSSSFSMGPLESYIEKTGRKYHFEYGKARMWGSLGWATATFFAGAVYNINPDYNFWLASASGAILLVIVMSTKIAVSDTEKEAASSVSFHDILTLLKLKDFWAFALFSLCIVCVYGVYDQQFPRYFANQFANLKTGNEMFGYLNSLQVFLEAGMMFVAPSIVNKIGPKKSLLFAAFIMASRITLSGVVVGPVLIATIKLMHSFELPVLLIAVFKYLDLHFESRLSSTLYLFGYQFFIQFGTIVFAPLVGIMYDSVGFRTTYMALGIFVFVVFLASMVSLRNDSVSKVAVPLYFKGESDV